ncbi:putative phosphoglycerate mutase [Plectosphaerella plurivora]|uniref:Phosphoglycerate mutase n=1 Tax=Plectosphaerella plurivora TaxID=936078 RepID=A0A9P9AE47_9PEZI|nr:putative phosphoglycerate mutase [Plectosphaerella plurivora]
MVSRKLSERTSDLIDVSTRVGETEWAKTGRYTGKTEIDLNPSGVAQVTSTAKILVGEGKFIEPSRLSHVFVSPRKRAQTTFRLLDLPESPTVTDTEDIAEWDYGEYEGLKTDEIIAKRKSQGLDQETEWSIWRDGCVGGESQEQVTERLDRLVAEIREIQAQFMGVEKPMNVMIVAHGHILRCFVKRWIGQPLEDQALMMRIDPGAICALSYRSGKARTPVICLGMALPA